MNTRTYHRLALSVALGAVIGAFVVTASEPQPTPIESTIPWIIA